MTTISEQILGQTTEDFMVMDLESSQAARRTLAEQAHTSLHIFDTDLRDPLYRDTGFIDILRTFIATESRPEVKIIISNINQALRNAHTMFYLSQRSPSCVQIRLAPQNYNHSFFIADATGYLDHRMGSGYEAEVNFNHPSRAQSLINFFNEVWNRSSSPSDSRNLNV